MSFVMLVQFVGKVHVWMYVIAFLVKLDGPADLAFATQLMDIVLTMVAVDLTKNVLETDALI